MRRYFTRLLTARALTVSVLLLTRTVLMGQTASLALSSGSVGLTGTIPLNLSLTAPPTNAPSGLQWTLAYTPGDVASISMAAGPALTSAGKSLSCNAISGSVTCLASGLNASSIGSGVVATVSVTLPSLTSGSSVPIAIGNLFGVLPDGTIGSLTGTGGSITVLRPVPSVSSLSPSTAGAGGAGFTLTVNGSNFVNGSVVNWNGSARSTTFVSATQLNALINASDISSSGTTQVTVSTAAPGGGTSSSLPFTISPANPVPAISSLSPSSVIAGSAGFTLTVNGSNFINSSVVKWNGASRTTTFISATQIQAAISSSDITTSGSAQITVSNPAPGGGTSLGVGLIINPANPVPAISSLSPSSVTAGSVAFTLTVNGSNFISGSVVKWNGASRTTTYLSATQLQASISAADISASGTAQVTVFNPTPGGGTSSGSTLTINQSNPVPAISSLSPSSTTAGGVAFTLTVNGSNFVNGSVVNWKGSPRTTTFVSATQLQASISAADISASGSAQITVFNPTPGGGTSSSISLIINQPNPVPAISSLSPASATAGGVAFTLTVNGSNFLNGSVVNWNGASRTTTFVSATRLQASISAADINASGTAQVTVFNPTPGGGTSSTSQFTITAVNPVPAITSLSPSTALAGGASFTLTVRGTGFVSGAVVNWNGSARTTTFQSSTQVQATVNSTDIASLGTAQITVFNPTPGGGTSATSPFTISAVNPVPTVSSLTPSSATAGGAAFTLTVRGTGFVNGAVVNWNASARTTTFVSSTQLQATVNAADIGSVGTAQVTVFNPTPGGGTSSATSFAIIAANPAPLISSLSPSSANAGGSAFTLVVNGSSFVSGSVVNWSGSARTTTFVSSTQLQANISSTDINASGTAQVTVFNPTPGGGTSASAAFTINSVNPVPSITSLSPSTTTAGGSPFTLTVSGTGFIASSVVNWNGSPRTTTFLSSTQLRTTISSADINAPGTGQVTVFSPTPGGGTSAASPLSITNPSGVSVTISSSPAGLQIVADGTTYTAPQTFSWTPGSTHTLNVSTPQTVSSVRYAFSSWSNSGAQSQNFLVPSSATTVTASFAVSQYLLTQSVFPSAGGSLSANPISADSYYAVGSVVQLMASPNPGCTFVGFTGDLSGTTNPQSLSMNTPRSVSANFSCSAGTPSGLQFVPITPCRVMDTRGSGFAGAFGPPALAAATGRSIPIQSSSCNIPSAAQAYSLNVTAIPKDKTLGFLSIWPSGQPQPNVSTLNSWDGNTLANAAIVPAGTGGAVTVLASNSADLVIDINGYFVQPNGNSLAFYPTSPCRLADTRNPVGTFGGPMVAGNTSRDLPVPLSPCEIPSTARAYSLNVTVAPKSVLYYVTTWPTGQPQPFVSTLNSFDGTTLANAAIVPAGANGAVSFYASQDTDLIVDINGYFAPPGGGGLNFYTATPCRIADTRNATGTFGGPALDTGQTRNFPLPQSACGLPAQAGAYSLNMTVVPDEGPLWFLSTWPAGMSQIWVSTLNAFKGIAMANAALVPAGSGGGVNIYVSNPSNVIIDVNGYFAQ